MTIRYAIAAGIAGFFLFPVCALGEERPLELPSTVLWAWERPEDLRFLDPAKRGVAYLAATLTLAGDIVSTTPRQQPIRVPAGTQMMAVVRLETDRRRPPSLTAAQRDLAAGTIAGIGSTPGLAGIQIDFDALSSERTFYRDLLREVRKALPARAFLSITALASWCFGDPWIAGLPIDEAVPMLFRMGADRSAILARLRNGDDFRLKICRASVGVSTDEPHVSIPSGRRIYLFHPRPWNAAAYEAWSREAVR